MKTLFVRHRYIISGLFVFVACLFALTLHGGKAHADPSGGFESYCPQQQTDPGHTIHAVYPDQVQIISTSPDMQINLLGQSHICQDSPYSEADNIIIHLPYDTSPSGPTSGVYDSDGAHLNYYHHDFNLGNLYGKGATSATSAWAITVTGLHEDENCFRVYFDAQATYGGTVSHSQVGSWFFCIYYHNPGSGGTGCSGSTPYAAVGGTPGCCPQPNMTGFVSGGTYYCACPSGQHWDNNSGTCQNDTGNNCTDSNADNYNQPGPCRYSCHDPNANNYGGPAPCTYTPRCNDPNADNYNQPGSCTYTCHDPSASNYGGPAPCTYPPKCQDPSANNYGGLAPCTYKPTTSIYSSCSYLWGYANDPDTGTGNIALNIYENNNYIGTAYGDSSGYWTYNIAARTNDANTRTYSAIPIDTQGGPNGNTVSTNVGPCNQPPTTSVYSSCSYNWGWLWGWATDPDTSGSDVQVQIYMDGNYIGSATGQGNNSGYWTFSTYPSYTNNAQNHTFTVYALDTWGGPSSAPATTSLSQCNNPPTTTIDGNCQWLWGYASDPDTPSTSIRVDIYRNGTKIGSTNTDPNNSNYWVFGINNWKSFRRDSFMAYPIDSSGGPAGSPASIGMGPCMTTNDVGCNITTSPANVETGQPFTVTASLNYFPVPADGVPYRPAYTMAIQVGPGGSLYSNSDANYTATTLSTSFTTPGITSSSPGTFSIVMTFKGGNIDQTCNSTVAIGTYPYYRVYGGDVSNGGGVAPACSSGGNGDIITWNKNNSGSPPGYNSYGGAGTQLAAFALGHLKGFATGTNNYAAGGDPTGLAFANDSSNISLASGQYGGGFTGVRCIPDFYAGHHKYQDNGGSVDLTLTGAHSWEVNGPVSIPGTLIKKGAKLTLYVNGDITIWNIGENYDTSGSYGTPDQIPSFYVVATGNIYIIGDSNSGINVSHLDGVYVSTGGTIYTCAKFNSSNPDLSGPFPVNSDQSELINNCQGTLSIDGALIAKQIKFLRLKTTINGSLVSAQPGDGPDPNKQAEIFQFTPEMWLTQPAPDAGSGTNAPTIDSITNLPPVL